eukprot:5256471-Alexandrium_andersonii.AAC.1
MPTCAWKHLNPPDIARGCLKLSKQNKTVSGVPCTNVDTPQDAGAIRVQSVRRPRHCGRATQWATADPLHRGPLGPTQSRPQAGDVLWARTQ